MANEALELLRALYREYRSARPGFLVKLLFAAYKNGAVKLRRLALTVAPQMLKALGVRYLALDTAPRGMVGWLASCFIPQSFWSTKDNLSHTIDLLDSVVASAIPQPTLYDEVVLADFSGTVCKTSCTVTIHDEAPSECSRPVHSLSASNLCASPFQAVSDDSLGHPVASTSQQYWRMSAPGSSCSGSTDLSVSCSLKVRALSGEVYSTPESQQVSVVPALTPLGRRLSPFEKAAYFQWYCTAVKVQTQNFDYLVA